MLSLGIDLGTSKVAAAIVDIDSRTTLDAVALLHQAAVPGAVGYSEQDASRLEEALNRAILGLHEDFRRDVAVIGITGQMHGVMLWSPETGSFSRLIDWQDQRCLSPDFQEDFRQRTGVSEVYSGFGWATLEWLRQSDPGILDEYRCAGTLADFVASRLVGSEQGVMDPTNADSWGLFDLDTREWCVDALAALAFPDHLIPGIQPSAALLGCLLPRYAESWGLARDLPVSLPIGDNPASIYASLTDPDTDIALTLGTGGQLAVVLPAHSSRPDLRDGRSFRPYLDERVLAVSTSLCGGSAFGWLADAVERWLGELGLKAPPHKEILDTLVELGLRADPGGLRVETSFTGERHAYRKRGRIEGLDLNNFSLGNLARGICSGVLDGLLDRMPPEYLVSRERVIGSGNALRRSALMREAAAARLGLPLELSPIIEEAACGAALLAAHRILQAG